MKISLLNTSLYPHIMPQIKNVESNKPVYFIKSLQTDVISFSSSRLDKDDAYALRNIPNQTCACCGKGMINEQDYNNLKAKDFEGPASQVLKKLKPFHKNMKKVPKTVYNLLKRTANKYPMYDLQTIIAQRFYYHLGRLEIKQLKVINDAVSKKNNLSLESQLKLEKIMDDVKAIIFVEPKDIPDKRKRIKSEFNKLRNNCPHKDRAEVEKIIELLNKLPHSKNDVDAFMVKHVHRSNREIAQKLLSPSLPTLDHVKATKKGGKDFFSNILVLCSECNTTRGHMSYTQWFLIHPEMPKNIQKNINKIINEINEGRLSQFVFYPKAIKKTLERETQNQVNIDISALKL